MRSIRENIWAQTHTGYKRQRNEDRYLIHSLKRDAGALLAVADGMGGAAGGHIAAQIAVDTLREYQTPGVNPNIERDLANLLEKAGKRIIDRAKAEPSFQDMGTTATAALLTGQEVYWAHVGDSRLYVNRRREMVQITTDHTFIQDLVDDGTLTQADAERHPLRNMLDQCLGCTGLKPDTGRFPFSAGEKLLLCSDGLTRHVSEETMSEILQGDDAREIADRLLRSALDAGGRDNVTVVVVV